MNDQQHPLRSGFTAASTADEVLAGADLTGINVIVTGGHSGIGLAATRALARAGASVTVPARDPDRAAANLAGIDRVRVHRMDLLDPVAVDAFAVAWTTTGRPLHVLINNAAVPAPGTVVRDSRGFEVQFATSHLGHYQLTLALHDALRAAHGARVVNVSSGAHRLGTIRWDDPNFTDSYDPGVAYAQAKLANVLFAVALDRRLAPDGIRGYAVHPGVVLGTQLNAGGDPAAYRAMGLLDQTAGRSSTPRPGRRRSSRAPRRSCSPPPADSSTGSAGSTSRTATSLPSTTGHCP